MRTLKLLLLTLLPALAQVRYNAPRDREILTKPPLPALGRAGSVVRDPTFGSRILRVTDLETHEASSCTSPAAALQNPWNADSTRFVVVCDGSVVSFDFDPGKLSARRRGTLDLRASPAFSFNDRDRLYGVGIESDDRKVLEFDFRRRKYRTLLDLEKVVRRFEGGASSVTVSANERLALAFGGIQDTWRYVLLIDVEKGAQRLVDTRAATVDGKPAGFPMGWGVHFVNIDKSGRYVIISKGEGSKPPNLVVWDTETDVFAEVKPEGCGHLAAGYGYLVNGCGDQSWAQWLVRPLDPARVGSYRKLITPELRKDQGGREEHSSWANARPDAWMPVLISITRSRKAKNPPAPWEDEIIAVSTDPDRPAVWRLANHRSLYDGADFWDWPRGNVSPDGRFFLFTSNWERTLGTTPKGRPRQDAFVLELPLGTR